jgi:Reverse transcriptase (RNA-dependent DNA polymerase)
MNREIHAIKTKGVWKIVPLSSMQHGRKLGGNRWVYTEKDDKTYRSRTFTKGFSQVAGKDLTDSHVPVKKELAINLSLII